MARQTEPAGFAVEPVIRKTARRRARFTAATACGVLAVIATAVTVPYALRPATSQVASLSTSRNAGTGAWPASFGCDSPLPSALPNSSGFGLKVSVVSVKQTTTGAPTVTWTMSGTLQPGNTMPTLGDYSAVILVVRDDGTVIAALPTPQPAGSAQMPFALMNVSAREVARAAPRMGPCHLTDWAPVWSDRSQYRVVVLLSAWAEFRNFRPSMLPARYSVIAPLPLG